MSSSFSKLFLKFLVLVLSVKHKIVSLHNVIHIVSSGIIDKVGQNNCAVAGLKIHAAITDIIILLKLEKVNINLTVFLNFVCFYKS